MRDCPLLKDSFTKMYTVYHFIIACTKNAKIYTEHF